MAADAGLWQVLTQEELAEAARLSPHAVSALARAFTAPPIRTPPSCRLNALRCRPHPDKATARASSSASLLECQHQLAQQIIELPALDLGEVFDDELLAMVQHGTCLAPGALSGCG
jgi:hypothetical protein